MSEKEKEIKESKRIIVSFKGEWYDVTDFCHPGGDVFGEYHGKPIDEEVYTIHCTDEPITILAEAKRLGEFEGIIFKGNTFKDNSN